jgi:hypothetical protein
MDNEGFEWNCDAPFLSALQNFQLFRNMKIHTTVRCTFIYKLHQVLQRFHGAAALFTASKSTYS